MAKFFDKFGALKRKGATEQADEVDASEEQETASPWDILTEKVKKNRTTWGDLLKVKFAGDKAVEPMDAQPAESEMGGGIHEEDAVEAELAEQEPNETLLALKDFFRLNMATKDEMMRLAPEEADMYSEESRIDYVDKVFKGYRDMEWRFLKINEEFQLVDSEKIEEFFDAGEKNFAIGDYGAEAVKDLYIENVSKMRPEFVEEVKRQCYGYGLESAGERFQTLLGQVQSVNELLHACHSAIMNDEEILKKVPMLAEKREGDIVLRGDKNEIGQQIFEALPEQINTGPIDIVSVEERAIMMVRDRGHALLVQAEPFEPGSKQVLVNYDIPKIIDREMIERLPGVDKITDEGANGQFLCEADEVGEKMKEFIEMVPTDADLKF